MEDILLDVLLELTRSSLSLGGYHSSPFVTKAAVQFVAMRRDGLSDRAVSLFTVHFFGMLPSLYRYACNTVTFSSNLVALQVILFLSLLISMFCHRLCNYLSCTWNLRFASGGGSKPYAFGSNISRVEWLFYASHNHHHSVIRLTIYTSHIDSRSKRNS
jgi:hypothetical protein